MNEAKAFCCANLKRPTCYLTLVLSKATSKELIDFWKKYGIPTVKGNVLHKIECI